MVHRVIVISRGQPPLFHQFQRFLQDSDVSNCCRIGRRSETKIGFFQFQTSTNELGVCGLLAGGNRRRRGRDRSKSFESLLKYLFTLFQRDTRNSSKRWNCGHLLPLLLSHFKLTTAFNVLCCLRGSEKSSCTVNPMKPTWQLPFDKVVRF